MRHLLYWFPVLMSLTAAQAQTPALAPVPTATNASPVEIIKQYQDLQIMEDGSYLQGTEYAYKVLNQQGISALQQMEFSFTRGYQNLQIITAYTLKADGARIDVPKDRMLVGHGATSLPGFQDETSIQVFFPNVEIGDQVVIRTLRTQNTPWYEGEFAITIPLQRSYVTRDARVRVSAPADMQLRIDDTGVEGGTVQRFGDENVWVWTYENDTPISFADDAVSELDTDPRVVVTTFAEYGDVAAAYAERSRGKTEITPEIQALADELTAGVDDTREQVRILYHWVASQINYVAIFLGAGGFTPHEAHEVLSNRYGDCKDHVVLLEALLAAKGIESTPVLIYLGSSYELSEAPSPFFFNHVITYIPLLDMYLDSTSPLAPFGTLPFSDSDKPVVHVATGLEATTPRVTAENSYIGAVTSLEVREDGSVTGHTKISAAGSTEVSLRSLVDSIAVDQEDDHFTTMLGPGATGSLSRYNPRDLDQPYSYEASYTIPNALFLPGPGALPAQIFYRPFSFSNAIGGSLPAERFSDYLCVSNTLEEVATVQLPENISILALPESQTRTADGFTLTISHEQIDSRTITRNFSLVIDHPVTVCSPEHYARVRPDLANMMTALRAQIVYR